MGFDGKIQLDDINDSFPMGECQESRDAQQFFAAETEKLQADSVDKDPRISLDTSDLLTAGLVTVHGPAAIDRLISKTPMSRGKAGWLALAGLGMAIAATMRPSDAFADTPETSTDVFELEIYRQGGPDWRWLFNWQQATTTDRTHGPLKMPPLNQPAAPAGYGMVPDPKGGPNLVSFFDLYGDMTEVIITDQETTSHSDGTQRGFNGSVDMTNPSVAALRAAVFGHGAPLSFMSGANVNFTGGLVPPNSLNDIGNIGALTKPNIIAKTGEQILIDPVETHVVDNRANNVGTYANGLSYRGKRVVPSLRSIGEKRKSVQNAGDEINKILADIKKIQNDPKNKNNPLQTSALLGVQLFKMKQLVGLVLQIGSFDTHGETNGAKQMALNQTIMLTINAFFIACKAAGIKGRVALHGDFGRHAAGSGDPSAHHHVGSVVNIGEGIKGPRVVGKVDPNSSNIIGEKNNYADVMVYRRWLNGLSINTLKKVITGTTGVDVIKSLISKQTGQLMRDPSREINREQMFDPVRDVFKRFFT